MHLTEPFTPTLALTITYISIQVRPKKTSYYNLYSSRIMKPTDCEIALEKPVVLLYGSPIDAAGAALRGTLILDVKKETKVKSIQLKLEGKVQVSWGTVQTRIVDDTVVNNTLTIIEPNSTYVLPVGQSAFEFEFRFPGHLPETVWTHFGQVNYCIKAIIERPYILRDIRVKKAIVVKRFPNPNDTDIIDDSYSVNQVYKDVASVNIQIPKRSYVLGETVPFHIKVVGKAAICRVAFRLIQNVNLCAAEATSTKLIQQWREISNSAVNCQEFLLNIRLPKNDIFQPDCTTKYIQTSHEAMIIVSFDIGGKVECGYVSFNIGIVHKNQEDESLPVYTPIQIESDTLPKLPSYKEVAVHSYQTCLIR
ncbi:hypothetical protein K7432_000293 [Basidiobolus ranarum]|uniref:Arrestin C-terminal-like domain-containing protein n=1 Tax=Basidiobolus ranarum TaxID=34480 RepID=A0ABR2X570_9FUNG